MREIAKVALEGGELRRFRILAQPLFADPRSYPSRRPRSRRRQRSGSPPTTDASTMSRSHFQGARSPPSTTAVSASAGGAAGDSGSAACRRSSRANPSTRSSAGGRTSVGVEPAASGTCASERVSAKRIGRQLLAAQLRIARKARPDGCGRRAPRSNQAGIPARSKAFSTRPAYSAGDRRNTAISSKRTPRRASSRMRRAISTDSRPSPGAENSRTSPRAHASGGCRVENSYRRSAVRSESPAGSSDLDLRPRVVEPVEGGEIAERHGDERLGRRVDQRPGERELDLRFERHVEEEQRQARDARRRLARHVEERRRGRRRCGSNCASNASSSRGEIGTAERKGVERARPDPRHREIVERPHQRAREAGRARRRGRDRRDRRRGALRTPRVPRRLRTR